MRPLSQVRQRAHGLAWFAAISAVAAIGMAVTGMAGGLRKAGESVPDIRPGQTATGHRYSVDLVNCTLTDKDPNAFDPSRGRFLVFQAKILNLGKQEGFLGDVAEHMSIRLEPGGTALNPVQANKDAYVDRDPSKSANDLQPGIPEAATLVFAVPATGPRPTAVEIGLKDQVYQRDFFYDELGWLDSGTLFGRVTLPVAAARPPAAHRRAAVRRKKAHRTKSRNTSTRQAKTAQHRAAQ